MNMWLLKYMNAISFKGRTVDNFPNLPALLYLANTFEHLSVAGWVNLLMYSQPASYDWHWMKQWVIGIFSLGKEEQKTLIQAPPLHLVLSQQKCYEVFFSHFVRTRQKNALHREALCKLYLLQSLGAGRPVCF